GDGSFETRRDCRPERESALDDGFDQRRPLCGIEHHACRSGWISISYGPGRFRVWTTGWLVVYRPGMDGTTADQIRLRLRTGDQEPTSAGISANSQYRHPMSSKALVMLKFGAQAWNRWRQENPETPISLDGAKLDGLVLTSINFSRVSLREASL